MGNMGQARIISESQNPDVVPADLLNSQNQEISEKKANRFAAEFLVDEQLLKQEIDIYKVKKYAIKSILQLASLFTVPKMERKFQSLQYAHLVYNIVGI